VSPGLDPDIEAHYGLGEERDRLGAESGAPSLELVRTRELLTRFLPEPPARVLDVGGGAGAYAAWLARRGYSVHLVDPVPLHVEQALAVAAAQPDHPFTASVGDARTLDAFEDGSVDVALLMGPLYHLTERDDRLEALREAFRVLSRKGVLVAVGISRFASLLDGLKHNRLGDVVFRDIVERDLHDGQHRNPDPVGRPEWFTTAFFHHPDELAAEVSEAGFEAPMVLAIEGPGWLVAGAWEHPERREHLLMAARAAEAEPSLRGVGGHLMAVARKPARQKARNTAIPHVHGLEGGPG